MEANTKRNYILVFLVLITIGMYIWLFVLYSNLKKCESSESSFCPQMWCQFADAKCENLPYRIDKDNNKICAQYLLTQAAPVIEDKINNGGI
jgi:hypothetical protein